MRSHRPQSPQQRYIQSALRHAYQEQPQPETTGSILVQEIQRDCKAQPGCEELFGYNWQNGPPPEILEAFRRQDSIAGSKGLSDWLKAQDFEACTVWRLPGQAAIAFIERTEQIVEIKALGSTISGCGTGTRLLRAVLDKFPEHVVVLVAATKADVEYYEKFDFGTYHKTDTANKSFRCHLQLAGYRTDDLEKATEATAEGGWEWGGRGCSSGGQALMMRIPADRKWKQPTGKNWEVRELSESEQQQLGIAKYDDDGQLVPRGKDIVATVDMLPKTMLVPPCPYGGGVLIKAQEDLASPPRL
jgi:hypothetical protein|eukprot:COSAG01_NODE_1345_length_10632_cov_648.255863_8_plen_302_part_00